MFLKECKYIKKRVRHIHHNLSDFPYSSDESYEEWIKAISLIIFENLFFEGAILKGLIENVFFFNTRFITFQAFSIKAF